MSDQSSTDGQLPYSKFKHERDTTPENKFIHWENLAKHLLMHKELSSKESGKLWSATRYIPDTTRLAANVESLSCIVLDFDDGSDPNAVKAALADYEYVMHSTYRHSKEKPRFRVVAPIYSEIPKENWGQFWTNVKDYLAEKGVNVDTACSDPCRIYYEPSCPPGGERFSWHNKERWLLEDNLKPERKPLPKSRLIRVSAGNAQPKLLLDMALKRATYGNRNDSNFWLACQLRDNGVPYSDVDEWMIGYAGVVSDLGPELYTVQEAMHCAQQAYGRPPRDPMALATELPTPSEDVEIAVEDIRISDYPESETGNGELFAALYATKARYLCQSERWLIWDGMHWRSDQGGEISMMCKEVARTRRKLAQEQLKNEADVPGKKGVPYLDNAKKFARTSESMFSRAQTENAAMKEPPIGVSIPNCREWDSDNMLLGVRNGVVDLQTGICRPGQQADRITQYIDIDFDPEATCPVWEMFLDGIMKHDPDMVDALWKYAGYSICGSIKEQIWFVLYGLGANGKSKFIETISAILACYANHLAFTAISLSKDANRQSNDIFGLKGKRFVWATEPTESIQLDVGRIKNLSGDSELTARALFHEAETFTNTSTLWVGVNHKPQVDDRTKGFWRKVRLIPFEQEYELDQEKPLAPGVLRADLELEEKFKQEYQGILNWLISGCIAWQKDGMPYPTKVRLAVKEYDRETDPLADFIDQCITIDPEAKVRAQDAYAAYKSFSNEQGMGEKEALTSTTFGRKMKDKFTRVRGNQGNRYLGISVKGQPTIDDATLEV